MPRPPRKTSVWMLKSLASTAGIDEGDLEDDICFCVQTPPACCNLLRNEDSLTCHQVNSACAYRKWETYTSGYGAAETCSLDLQVAAAESDLEGQPEGQITEDHDVMRRHRKRAPAVLHLKDIPEGDVLEDEESEICAGDISPPVARLRLDSADSTLSSEGECNTPNNDVSSGNSNMNDDVERLKSFAALSKENLTTLISNSANPRFPRMAVVSDALMNSRARDMKYLRQRRLSVPDAARPSPLLTLPDESAVGRRRRSSTALRQRIRTTESIPDKNFDPLDFLLSHHRDKRLNAALDKQDSCVIRYACAFMKGLGTGAMLAIVALVLWYIIAAIFADIVDKKNRL